MIVGLPGTGIGGLFYAIIGVWLPMRRLGAKIRKKSHATPWAMIFRQFLLTLLILAAMWLTGEVVGSIIAIIRGLGHAGSSIAEVIDPRALASGKYNMLKMAFLYWTFAVVFGIHVALHGMRFALRLSNSAIPR